VDTKNARISFDHDQPGDVLNESLVLSFDPKVLVKEVESCLSHY
jgi:hypothetical protein